MALKILLIDNSPTIKKVFILSLKGYDYELKTATEPNTALELIKNFQPQLIFIDSLIQDLNTSKFIQKCHASIKAPIIFLKSSFLEKTDSIKKLIQSKVIKNILEKPFNKQALREIVHPYIYNENVEDALDIPIALSPIINWENDLGAEQTEVLFNTPNKTTAKTKNTNKQTENLLNSTESLQKIILGQLNTFFKDQSKKIIIELATPIVQEYVQEQVKILAKNIIEQEIQKMLDQSDTSSKAKQL